MLAEALAVVDKTGEHEYEAELYRLKGELSLQSEVRSPQSKLTSPQHPAPRTPARRAGTAHRNASIGEAGTVGIPTQPFRGVKFSLHVG